VDKYLASAVKGLVDESIGDTEVLLNVLLRFVVDLKVEVLEVSIALSVGLAGYVEDVGDSGLDKVARLKGGLERPHHDTLVYLEQADVSDSLLTVDVAGAEVDVGEPAADDLLLLSSVSLTVIVLVGAVLLLVKWSTAKSWILELGDGNSVLVLCVQVLVF